MPTQRAAAARWHRRCLVAAAVACWAVVPAQALELSANAAANQRNTVGETAWSNTTPAPATALADVTETSSPQPALPAASTAAAAPSEPAVEQEQGGASWYGRYFHGRRTANGERYNQNELTAAHKTLPFGTVVRVRSETNGKEVDVRINDRGPFVAGRVIDLSQAAAKALDMLQLGVKKVTLLLPPALRPGKAGTSTANTNTSVSPSQATADSSPLGGESSSPTPAARALTPAIR